jgi:hypothetical protein
MKTDRQGGEAVGSGSYGCVFRPALKCESKENRTQGVSKLMVNKKAAAEFQEITKFIPIIKQIENNKDYFLIPKGICQIDKLTDDDTTKFDNKCKNAFHGKFNESNVNNNLKKFKIINLPDGGNDVEIWARQQHKMKDIIDINNGLIRLLKRGIIPMNNLNLYHTDIKDTNVLVGNDNKIRIIDWGLSGIVDDIEHIPSFLSHRPLQFNMPFSCVLFNHRTIHEIGDLCSKNKTLTKIRINDFIKKHYNSYIKREIGEGHYDYLNNIFSESLSKFGNKHFNDILFNYLTDIIYHYGQGGQFNFKEYFKVFLKNADVWGFITIYLALVHIKDSDLYRFSNQLKNVILKHLLKAPEKCINVTELSRDLKSLNKLVNMKKSNNKLFSIIGLPDTPESSFKNKSTVTISFEKSPSVETKTSPSVETKKSHSGETKKSHSVTKKSHSVTKKSHSVETKKSHSVETKKTRRPRCPNGTRRNKKTGNCEPNKK